jgi:hypothetical protein
MYRYIYKYISTQRGSWNEIPTDHGSLPWYLADPAMSAWADPFVVNSRWQGPTFADEAPLT